MIHITNSERVYIVGATGSGKTVLAKRLIRNLSRVVVIDPKHTFSLDGYKVIKNYKLPWLAKEYRVIIRPVRGDDEKMRAFLEKQFYGGNVTIYIDELASLVHRFPLTLDTLEDIARTGREKRVSLWTVSQRPRHIPRHFMTEAESIFVFNLRSGDDRDYITEYAGDGVSEMPGAYNFYYVRADANSTPKLLTLDIKSGEIHNVRKEVVASGEIR